MLELPREDSPAAEALEVPGQQHAVKPPSKIRGNEDVFRQNHVCHQQGITRDVLRNDFRQREGGPGFGVAGGRVSLQAGAPGPDARPGRLDMPRGREVRGRDQHTCVLGPWPGRSSIPPAWAGPSPHQLSEGKGVAS